jgi:hypothetical protein
MKRSESCVEKVARPFQGLHSITLLAPIGWLCAPASANIRGTFPRVAHTVSWFLVCLFGFLIDRENGGRTFSRNAVQSTILRGVTSQYSRFPLHTYKLQMSHVFSLPPMALFGSDRRSENLAGIFLYLKNV